MAARRKKKFSSLIAKEIFESLSELDKALKTGQPLEQVFTVRTVDLVLAPRMMDAEAIRLLRINLKASQAVFAAVLGVSKELVEHWEQGRRKPQPWALRMMHIFHDNPKLFYEQIQIKEAV